MIHIPKNTTLAVGVAAATLTAVAFGSVLYDAMMPVVGVMDDRVLTPAAPRGDDLVLSYNSRIPRQCALDNRVTKITDSHGVMYSISEDKLDIVLYMPGRISIAIPVPPQAAPGVAKFTMSYDRVCSLLWFWSSAHHVERPLAMFTIT